MIGILESLPGEIQDLIITHVLNDYGSAWSLSATSKYFRSIIDLTKANTSSKAIYLQELQHSDQYLYRHFACYGCLELKPKACFTDWNVRRAQYLNGKNELRRRCIQCSLRDGVFFHGTIMIVDQEPVFLCGCGRCSRSYCQVCRNCSDCLESQVFNHICSTRFMRRPDPLPLDQILNKLKA